jgi:hypothetical protein
MVARVMHGEIVMATESRRESWTRWLWVGAVALLLVPFFAMRFTSEVDWTLGDFIFAALMLAALCALVELAVRRSSKAIYRWAMALAALGGFAVIWVNLAVGIVASEDNDYNMVFLAIILATIATSAAVRIRAGAMAKILPVTGIALLVALAIGQMLGSDELHDTRIAEWVGVTVFAGMFALSALLFHRSEA